jgi:elongation factor G
MAQYTTADIRNLALTGAAGVGKTTLVETMLHEAGVIGRVGRVEDGNTVCDYDDIEKEHGHSLDSAVVHFDHDGAHINIIDTPGSSDFMGKTLSVFPAVETVAVMIDASAGIENATRRLMKAARESNKPRMIIINKIDCGTDLAALVEQIQEAFGSTCQPVNLPAGGGAGVINCFNNPSGDSDLGDISTYHTGIIDQVVEVDEALMETYLETGEVSPEQLHAPFEKALREGHLVPIVFTSARDNIGVKELMNFASKLCPNPTEGNPLPFKYGEGDGITEWKPQADPAQDCVAHVFKVSSDPFVGKLCVFRVLQGTLGGDIQPHIDDGKRGVRIAHVFKLQGREHAETKQIIAGDIGAVAKIDEIDFNSILHTFSDKPLLRAVVPNMPKPMYGLAIEGTSKGAETKIGEALKKMMAEDPTLDVERVQATNETVMRGLGEQHLRIKLQLLKDRYGVEVDTRPPKVAYKETITGKAEGHHRHKKQSGGAGQFGEVYLRVEPIATETEVEDKDKLEFVDDTFGGSVPKQFMPAIEKGIRQVLHDGAIAGYPMQNIKVSVYDGKHHPVDSKEVAFITAGKKAFIDAVQKASPVLLEPFVRAEISVPADMIGDISSDLSGRRGRIQGTEMLPGNQAVVIAEAPLAEMMNYSSQLKSMTAGAGTYTMEYSHDEQTPPNIQAEVVAAYKPRDDDD